MVVPGIFARIVEPDQGFAEFVPGSDAAALAQVAKSAGEGEVAEGGFAALLFADDVVDVVAGEGYGLGNTTILAAIIGCFGDLAAKDDGNVGLTHKAITEYREAGKCRVPIMVGLKN